MVSINIVALFLGIFTTVLSGSSPSFGSSSQADDFSLMHAPPSATLHQHAIVGLDDVLPKLTPCGKCTSYPNVIRLGGTVGAGLMHRFADASTWSAVAASLCARLEVRPPCEKLQDDICRNMSRSLKLTYLIDILAADGSSMMDPRDNVSGTRVQISMHGPFAGRYAEARAAVDSGKVFDWFQNYDWVTAPNIDARQLVDLLANRRHTCKDSSIQPSTGVKSAVAAFRSKLSIKPSEYVALHIHRKYAPLTCDTNIGAVVNYVTCSLRNFPFDTYPVIFFTDETDPAYLADLLGNLTQAFEGRRKVYHGDAEFTSFEFGASSKFLAVPALMLTAEIVLRQDAGVELLIDRTHCVSCEMTPQPTQFCSGHCGFEEYVIQSEVHTTYKADMDMHIYGLNRSFLPKAVDRRIDSNVMRIFGFVLLIIFSLGELSRVWTTMKQALRST